MPTRARVAARRAVGYRRDASRTLTKMPRGRNAALPMDSPFSALFGFSKPASERFTIDDSRVTLVFTIHSGSMLSRWAMTFLTRIIRLPIAWAPLSWLLIAWVSIAWAPLAAAAEPWKPAPAACDDALGEGRLAQARCPNIRGRRWSATTGRTSTACGTTPSRPRTTSSPQQVRRANPGAVSGRVGPVGRDEARRADRAALVSPHVHSSTRPGPASACCCTSARSIGRRTVWVNGKERRQAPRRLRPVQLRHHRRAEARAASRNSSSPSGTRPTPARSRAASRSASRAASGTRRRTGIWQTVWLEPVPAGVHRVAQDRARRRQPACAIRRRHDRHERQRQGLGRQSRRCPTTATRRSSRAGAAASRRRSRSSWKCPTPSSGRPTTRSSTTCT